MTIKIDKKIIAYSVVKPNDAPVTTPLLAVQHMHESVERPDVLPGATYKVKTPLSDHALYITINDIVLNRDTPDEIRRPFEIFINSKAMEHFAWTVALTRMISVRVSSGRKLNVSCISVPAAMVRVRRSGR